MTGRATTERRGPGSPARPRWWAALLVALLGPVGWAGCSQPATLDDDRTETSIRARVAEVFDVRVAAVSCPDDIEVEAGGRFRCRAEVPGGVVEVQVRQVDGDGRLEAEPTRAVLVSERVAEDITVVLADQFDRDDATVACEGPAIRIEPVGASFRCLAVDGDESRVVEVRVRDASGALTYTLVPPEGA